MPERLLWQQLRLKSAGLKFRRQHPIGPYVVDYYCLQQRFVVEVDGESHGMGRRPNYDENRDRFLKENGFRVLRVSARRVLSDAAAAAEAIVARVGSPLHQPAAGPPPRAGEES